MCVFLSPLFSSIFLLIGFGDALLLNPPPENYSNFWEKGVTKSSHEKYKKTLNEFLQWLERGHGFVRNPETQMTSKFAFFKTHKTGSSSLHQIFSSFGIRRGLKFTPLNSAQWWLPELECVNGSLVTKKEFPCADLGVKHVLSKKAFWTHKFQRNVCDNGDGNWFPLVLDLFQQSLCSPDPIPVVTIVREPTAHLRSTLKFFHVERMVRDMFDPLSSDFRLLTRSHVEQFTDTYLINKTYIDINNDNNNNNHLNIDNTNLIVLILEQWYQSLVLIRRLFNWNLSEILYLATSTTAKHTKGYGIWENYEFGKKKTLDLDSLLYKQSVDNFQKNWEKLIAITPGGVEELEQEVELLEEISTQHFPKVCSAVEKFCESPLTPREDCTFASGVNDHSSSFSDSSLIGWYAMLCLKNWKISGLRLQQYITAQSQPPYLFSVSH